VVLALEVAIGLAVLIGIGIVVSADLTGIDDPNADEPDIGLPADRPLRSDDIDRLRFRAVSGLRGAIRGYRFGDVDAAMAQVRDTLRGYESEVEAGRQRGPQS
jgi:hypothetical protein